MKWSHLGGEVELPGSMYREMQCPLRFMRFTGGGDQAVGQDLQVISIVNFEVNFTAWGLVPKDDPAPRDSISVRLGPRMDTMFVVTKPGWLVRIEGFTAEQYAGAPSGIISGPGRQQIPYTQPRKTDVSISAPKIDPMKAARNRGRKLL
jgi:hypothetical protein